MFLIESRIRNVVSDLTYDVPFLRHVTSKKTLLCFHFFLFAFQSTVISQKLRNKKNSFFSLDTSYDTLFDETKKKSSEQRNDVTKNTSIFDFNM